MVGKQTAVFRQSRRTTQLLLFVARALSSGSAATAQADTVLWAWERPDVLRDLPPSFGVAVVVGFVRLQGAKIAVARERRFPCS